MEYGPLVPRVWRAWMKFCWTTYTNSGVATGPSASIGLRSVCCSRGVAPSSRTWACNICLHHSCFQLAAVSVVWHFQASKLLHVCTRHATQRMQHQSRAALQSPCRSKHKVTTMPLALQVPIYESISGTRVKVWWDMLLHKIEHSPRFSISRIPKQTTETYAKSSDSWSLDPLRPRSCTADMVQLKARSRHHGSFPVKGCSLDLTA